MMAVGVLAMTPQTFSPRSLITAAVVGVLAFGAAPAMAASPITPISPKKNAKVRVGKSPTFKMRVKGPGAVFVHVCKSKKKDAKGLICNSELIVQAKKKGGVYQVKPKFFDFPELWLNNPGTYYWQAHRIQCEGNLNDCAQEGPVVKFKVVG
jgi:hypothetical protein